MKSLRLLGVSLLFLFAAVSFAVNAYENDSGLRDAKGDLSLAKNGSMVFDKESYVFKGKAIKPKVIVYYDGKKIKKNKDYKLTVSNNNAIGYGTVTAEGKGKYTGRLSMEFPIVPQPVKIKKIKKNDSGFDACWNVAKDVDGYEIAYGTGKDFSDAVTERIVGNKNNTVKVYTLKPNTTYYIRLRSYKKVDSEDLCSEWSKAQKFLVPSYPDIITKGTYLVIDLSGGPDAVRYPVSYLQSEPAGGWTTEYKSTKMVFRLIQAGTFMMGSPENEYGRHSDETLHKVTLTRPFYIGVFEVTQKQWELVTNYKGGYGSEEGPLRPARKSSTAIKSDFDDRSFVGFLRSRTGLEFDLPTEAQWEYACRAGTSTALYDGNNITNTYYDGNLNKLARNYWNKYDGKGGYEGGATTVGSYLPNAWGLYDMLGNAWEVCLDRYVEDLGSLPVVDPIAQSYAAHVTKGGDPACGASGCRSAVRGCASGGGFRLVLVQ